MMVVALSACGGGDGTGIPIPPPLTSGPASNTLFSPGEGGTEVTPEEVAKAVCNKLASCLPIDPGDMAECLEDVRMITMFLIDGATFIACFDGLSCATLLQTKKIEDWAMACLDIDLASLGCNGSSLHYCSNQGLCKDLPCKTFCEVMGFSGGDDCVYGEDGPECKCKYDYGPPKQGD